MSPKIVCLFPDTNVFLQCHPLEQCNWSSWGDFHGVQLIVARPVQREIDQHKSKGNARVASRARKASSRFQEIIHSAERELVLRPAGPRVTLRLDNTRPDESLSGSLDYGAPDDQLVGIVHAYSRQPPGWDARVLTSDTGPMASAQSVGVPFARIPDEWLLPPELGEGEKRVKALEAELDRIKKGEPAFTLKCVDNTGRDVATLESSYVRYEPLSDNELVELMARISSGIPMAIDFGPRAAKERASQSLESIVSGPTEVFKPATNAEISEYKAERYPAWVKRCEEVLRNYHLALHHEAGQPTFRFILNNEGTRPGKDVLITFEAMGEFKIRPPSQRLEDDEDSARRSHHAITLPAPPDPPRGTWKPKYRNSIAELMRSSNSLAQAFSQDLGPGLVALDRIAARVPPMRDPNGFYWKPTRPMLPESSIALECEQWRHGFGPEAFDGEIYLSKAEDLEGAIVCRINAENLSNVPSLLVPLRIRVTRESVFGRATDLVASFLSSQGR